MMSIQTKHGEFIRFCLVGGLCTVIDAALFYVVRIIASYHVALVSGYMAGLVVNYFLTIMWTFKSTPTWKNAAGVIMTHLFNLFVVRMGLITLFVTVLGMNDRIAFAPTLCISVLSNYVIIKLIISKLHYYGD